MLRKASGERIAEVRLRALATVRQYPGLHLREIQRQLGTSAALAEYHLNLLEKWGLVTSIVEDGHRRFFPPRDELPTVSDADRRVLAALRGRIPFGVVLYLLEHREALHGDLADALGVRKSTLSYHLAHLEQLGLLAHKDGGRSLVLADPDRILGLLKAHSPTPDLVGAYEELWSNLLDALQQ